MIRSPLPLFRLDASTLVPAQALGAVLALGNFDGGHRGHADVMAHARALAQTQNSAFGVLTFTPHPTRYFQPDAPPFALQTPAQKHATLADFGADFICELRFTPSLVALSPADFVRDILVGHLAVAGVVVGDDFTFGQARQGTASTLTALGQAQGFAVTITPPFTQAEAGVRTSSTLIRAALAAGNPRRAAQHLGRPQTYAGQVEQGDQRGRTLGFPTANIPLGDYARPKAGVYAVRVQVGAHWHDGVANIGQRPTFDPPQERIEAHLFDFNGDLYGQTVAVALIDYLRPERKFPDLGALTTQIQQDCTQARARLATPT